MLALPRRRQKSNENIVDDMMMVVISLHNRQSAEIHIAMLRFKEGKHTNLL